MAYPPTNNHTDGTGEAWDALMANEVCVKGHTRGSKEREGKKSARICEQGGWFFVCMCECENQGTCIKGHYMSVQKARMER